MSRSEEETAEDIRMRLLNLVPLVSQLSQQERRALWRVAELRSSGEKEASVGVRWAVQDGKRHFSVFVRRADRSIEEIDAPEGPLVLP